MNVNLKDSIVVVDEGHNFSSSAKDASSFTLKSDELIAAKIELSAFRDFSLASGF